MFCNKCGNRMEDDAVFCAKCGNRVGVQAEVNIPVPQSPQGQSVKGKKKKPAAVVIAVAIVVVIIAGVFVWLKSSGGGLIGGDYTDPIAGAMVYVKGGTFTMGCTPEQGSDCDDYERPAHEVKLSDFYIGKYEVTQSVWQSVMGNNPSDFRGDNLPVENVSWNDIQEFIRKLNERTGKSYRLPTEAEWEYAARGGNKSNSYKYSGSNNAGDVAWIYDNSVGRTHSVGTRNANELGIYDMSGNVWEWVQDWYGEYSGGQLTNPTGYSSGSTRVVRGGSWGLDAWRARVSDRYSDGLDFRYYLLGFRLARSSK